MSLFDKDQIEIHFLQGFAYATMAGALARHFNAPMWAWLSVGPAVVLGVVLYWEIPEWRRGDRFEAFSDGLQRMIGAGVAIGIMWL